MNKIVVHFIRTFFEGRWAVCDVFIVHEPGAKMDALREMFARDGDTVTEIAVGSWSEYRLGLESAGLVVIDLCGGPVTDAAWDAVEWLVSSDQLRCVPVLVLLADGSRAVQEGGHVYVHHFSDSLSGEKLALVKRHPLTLESICA
ncbi:MAG TPA: hypothetical protein VJC05_01220 [Candidatus Andersenbacteria bacterium]|nr:MAG: hypothetical protein A2854_02030 [Parcubacteria group bacterium RIFCSPHIGHO2_01_FULL_56_18]HLD25647.1 hypothetical protein [Candidatus Andersenbacteria bacterium]